MSTWPWAAIHIMPQLRRAFDGPDLARVWLYESHPEPLGGRTPIEALNAGDVIAVIALLDALLEV